jgi:preprotein translocase subunit YajC
MDPGSLLMLAIVIVVFYFVLVRPQKRRMKEHQNLVSTLSAGDEVVSIGGVYGYVREIEDDLVWLEVDEGVEVRLSKQAISRRIPSQDEVIAAAVDEPVADVTAEPATGAAETAGEVVEPTDKESTS